MSTTSSGPAKAGKVGKDKMKDRPKPTHIQNGKTEGPPQPKHQREPTAEQVRFAQLVSTDKNEIDDPELQKKVKQVIELTNRSSDEVIIALHDCDNDINRAVNLLLEGEGDQGEWQEKKKKKRAPQTVTKAAGDGAGTKPDRREKSKDRDDFERPERPQRSSRGRQPPRLARGNLNNYKGRENDENDKNRSNSRSRDRSFERGRGRGRGQMSGPGRGRGRGGRNFQGSRFDKGPEIDTWTNETAENAEKKPANHMSSWGDMNEDWNLPAPNNAVQEDWNEDWSGSLEESKIFTPTVGAESSKVFQSVGDNDASVFTMDTQVFSASAMTNSSPVINDTGASLHNTASLHDSPLAGATSLAQTLASAGLGQNSLGENSMDQGSIVQPNITQNSLVQTTTPQLGQRLDLGMLLQKPTSDSSVSGGQQSQFLSQFTREATESIKNAVGIGSSNTSSSQPPQVVNTHMNTLAQQIPPVRPSPPGIAPPAAQQQQQRGQAKQPRTKMPPRSKIPASAVEMPHHIGNLQLDVQFGNWDLDNFSFGGGGATTTVSSSYTSPGSHLASVSASSVDTTAITSVSPAPMASVTPPKSSLSGLDSLSSSQSSRSGGGVFPNSSPATTPSKDFSRQDASQSNKLTAPDPIPFPGSQAERKSSPHFPQRAGPTAGQLSDHTNSSSHFPSQRTGQTAGQLSEHSTASVGSSKQSYSQGGYPSNYQSSNYPSQKSSSLPPSTTSNYSNSNMTSVQSGLSSQYSNHQGYQNSAFQGQNSYSGSNQDQNSVYLSSQQTGSSYPSQTSSSYQNTSSSTYPSQTVNTSSSYQVSNSTSGSSFSQSANSSSFPGQNERSGGSYQNQTNLSNSYPGQSNNTSNYSSQGQSNSSGSSTAYPNHASGYQNQSGTYHSRDSRDSSSSSYQTSVSQAGSSYQSGSTQSNSSYQSGSSQSNSTYPAQVSQTGGSSTNATYPRDSQTSQASFASHQSYGSSTSHQNNLQTSPMTATKLSDGLNKMSVKDGNSLESTQHASFDHASSSTTTASLTTTTSTTSSSLASGSVNVTSAGLGLNTTAASTLSVTSTTTATSKSSLPHTSKAPPNLPQGVPPAMLGPNYMIGQPGMPFIGLATQQPLYYEAADMQVLPQRLPLTGYYEMPFQPPTTLTGREQNTLASAPYTGAEQKMNRVDAQSPVQAAQTSQQQQQTQSAAHQQTFINPATLPPGYNYYHYPGGMLPGGYSFTPTMFPVGNLVPNVTNAAAHGGTTANAQFQKPGAAYGSHAYGTGFEDIASQGQDFKAYGSVAPSQAKAGGAAAVTSTATDITGTGYSKTHAQSYDKTAGFHAGTPPPFNIPLPTGTQAGAMGAPAAAYAPYMPVMTHQPHSQMLHHHLQQDSTGGSSRGSAQGTSQAKPGGNKPYSTAYWGTN